MKQPREKPKGRRIGRGLILASVVLILIVLLPSCAAPSPPPDACAWTKEIRVQLPIVIGSREYNDAAGLPLGAFANRDILTPGTAGQIVAHNRAVRAFCSE